MDPNNDPNLPVPAPVAPAPPAFHPTPVITKSGGSHSRWEKHETLKSVLSTIAILVIAPLIALTLTSYVFQSYEVDGSSMETTLQNKDRLIVYKVARTWSRITGSSYVPNRGDVVIFNLTENYDAQGLQKRQLIKRVIGLPGERVVVKDGVVTVYNQLHPEGFEPDRTLPYGSVITTTSENVDVTVPADHVFVCGDNRGNSLDSRSFGPIEVHTIVGKLLFRVFPLSKADTF